MKSYDLPSTWLHMSSMYFFLWLSSISLCEYRAICLSMHYEWAFSLLPGSGCSIIIEYNNAISIILHIIIKLM